MEIIIDATFINKHNCHKSIPIYLLRFISSIPEDKKKDFKILAYSTERQIFDKYVGIQKIYLGYSLILRIPKIRWYYKRYLYSKYITKDNFDVIFIVHELDNQILFQTSNSKVIVIHDLKMLKDGSKSHYDYFSFYDRFIKTADKVIAISEYTKKDICNNFHTDESKIAVVHNSICLPKGSIRPSALNGIDSNFILYVNTLQKYKNVFTLLKAYNGVKNQISQKLVLVGSNTEYWQKEMIPYIKENGFNDRVIRLENISDENLKWLYEHADLFVTTSLHEGFGYTPIEAAICKCPVVSTMCEALPETTQGLLNYYDPPLDDEALANVMLKTLAKSKEDLTAISKKFSEDYSREKQFEKIYDVLVSSTNNGI